MWLALQNDSKTLAPLQPMAAGLARSQGTSGSAVRTGIALRLRHNNPNEHPVPREEHIPALHRNAQVKPRLGPPKGAAAVLCVSSLTGGRSTDETNSIIDGRIFDGHCRNDSRRCFGTTRVSGLAQMGLSR
jgi:hypothetical protein